MVFETFSDPLWQIGIVTDRRTAVLAITNRICKYVVDVASFWFLREVRANRRQRDHDYYTNMQIRSHVSSRRSFDSCELSATDRPRPLRVTYTVFKYITDVSPLRFLRRVEIVSDRQTSSSISSPTYVLFVGKLVNLLDEIFLYSST